ncbi:MAG: hypothetical protein JWO56_1668, partial [Acidobacteria bacterium]|nr:hypothetical protein [Acidobacteriota bacterium]
MRRFPRLLIVPLLYLAVALATLAQYGITWDESIQSRYGELSLRYYATAGHDHSGEQLRNLRWYGPLFEMLPAAVYPPAPEWKYAIRHLFIVLTGFAALLGAGVYCTLIGADPIAGQLLLAFLPHFYGHSFNNSKDVPFACAIVWTMVTMARLIEQPTRKRLALAGLALGAALSIRVGALLFVGIVLIVILLKRRREAVAPFAAACLLAWVVMVVAWPAAHRAPLSHPVHAFGEALAFDQTYPVRFEGAELASNELPRRYLVEMLAITTPLLTLAFALAGLVIALRRRTAADLLLVAWLAVPLVLFVIQRPNVYDGIRHFLFLLPALAILGARAPRWAVVTACAVPLVAMLRLHPYEMTYYNALADPSRFETDYWASSYREAALWLRAHAPARRTRVLVAATSYSIENLRWYLPADRFDVVRTMDRGLAGGLPPGID